MLLLVPRNVKMDIRGWLVPTQEAANYGHPIRDQEIPRLPGNIDRRVVVLRGVQPLPLRVRYGPPPREAPLDKPDPKNSGDRNQGNRLGQLRVVPDNLLECIPDQSRDLTHSVNVDRMAGGQELGEQNQGLEVDAVHELDSVIVQEEDREVHSQDVQDVVILKNPKVDREQDKRNQGDEQLNDQGVVQEGVRLGIHQDEHHAAPVNGLLRHQELVLDLGLGDYRIGVRVRHQTVAIRVDEDLHELERRLNDPLPYQNHPLVLDHLSLALLFGRVQEIPLGL
ncbi:hypothetical protein OIY81_3133 [Cryptosporidium canis]|uniref:Uncharacterized protein n=1 Tax=Cryptosporidium canis TaxID=195482 RepID=A0ABQ8P5J6_9CRYT|nr:hypothetical protein OIY81_3133 [Cryptosporidium canis]KAJ1609042.1 hypothetical protein OJ252_2332 [Cryptosporidium canis]